jgi:hypothetical protein
MSATSMSTGSGPPSPHGPAAPRRFMADLRWPAVSRFPYRRRIRIGTPSATRVADEIEATLRNLRFRVEVRASPGGDADSVSILGERNLVQVSMSLTRALPLVTLIAAGAVLGLTDWLVTNQFYVVFPWIGAFAVAAFVFRLRIGGAYLSELILVEVRPLPATPPSTPSSVGTIWGAGRARSEGEMGPQHERIVVKITPLIPLSDIVAFVVQETSRHLARAAAPTRASQSM